RAGREVADVGAPQRARPPARGGEQCLLHRHAHVADGERVAELHLGRVARARVAVRGDRDGRAGVEHAARVGVGLAGGEGGGGGGGGGRVTARGGRRGGAWGGSGS